MLLPQDEEGAGSCKSCPAGTSSPAQSRVSEDCVPCPVGSFSPGDGSDCALCPVGTYGDKAGASECKDCPSNTDKEGRSCHKINQKT